jgi:type I restriction enzyme, S subunit
MEEADVHSWKAVHLRDHIYKPEYGFTTSATTDFIGPKFLRITDIQDDKVNWEKVPYCECKLDKDRYLLKSGDIVVARIGATTGKTYLVEKPPESIFASYLIRIRTREGLLPEFLNLFFQTETYWKQIDQNMGGRLKGGVNIPILQNLILPFPPIPKQRAIAHALRAVQAAREARMRELALERERKAALMEHLFTHGTRGEPTKMTAIGEMPESWRIVKLGEVVTSTQYGLSLRGNSQGSHPILRMNCLVDGYVKESDLQYVDLNGGDFDRFRLNRGDILFNRTNSCDLVGKTGLFDLNGDFVFASYLIRISVEKSRLLPEFVNYYINQNPTQTRLRMLASRGVSQSNINAAKLKGFLIPLPSCPEQKMVADILRACDAKISALNNEARLHDELFRVMLEELMSGKLPATRLTES